jgi:hypothetical protein
MNGNSMRVIFPYKIQGTWVFDDESFGLNREPFVAGIDDMIGLLVQDIPDAEKGFTLLFSDAPFPGFQVELIWRREADKGNWYYSRHFGMEGWLCPALYNYFDRAPLAIFVKAVSNK